MEIALYGLFVLVCLMLVVLVLIQQGKGAGVGFSMGGASQAMFGGSGGREFFIKVTAGLAVAFMVICIVLARLAVSDAGRYRGAVADLPAQQAPAPASAPALPGLPGSQASGSAPLQAAGQVPAQAAPAAKPLASAPAAPASGKH
jgi:preprotein translocase subunit SecG